MNAVVRFPPTAAQVTRAEASGALQPVSAAVATLLAPQRVSGRYSEDGAWLGQTEYWAPPAVVPPAAIPDIMRQAAQIDEALAPADRGALLARIHALLSHYRQEALPAAVEQAIAEDWADDLGEYPMWAVEQACREWRRHPTKFRYKPLPGDIRNLCVELVIDLTTMRVRVQTLLDRAAPARVTAGPASRAADVSDRIRKLAAARRM